MQSETQENVPQWAVDAAENFFSETRREFHSTKSGFWEYVKADLATIIAQHAPKDLLDNYWFDRMAQKDATIDRLAEALRETITFYHHYEDRNCLAAEAIESMAERIRQALATIDQQKAGE